MSRKAAIISAGDDAYFHLLDGMIQSLQDTQVHHGFDVCIMDVGLTPSQAQSLTARNIKVSVSSWMIDFPKQDKVPKWFAAMVNRPSLPQCFPGYETYIWIDADAWLQNADGVHAAIEAAKDGAIAIVAERFGKAMTFPVPTGHGGFKDVVQDESRIRQSIAACYRDCFGPDKEHFAQQTCFNTGFFALRADSPIWNQWRDYLQIGLSRLDRCLHKIIEQQALTLGFLEGKIKANILPNCYNWNMPCLEPTFDTARCQVLDPDTRELICLVHLTDLKLLHFVEVPNLEGETVRLPLRYQEFRRNAGRAIGISS